MAQFQSPLWTHTRDHMSFESFDWYELRLRAARKKSVISVDRLKPAFMQIDYPVPAQVKPVQLHPGHVQCRPRLRPGMADV
ncbi:hypothetical protein TNIN_9851 [Trichonephila inaurata madagascariensis]|uniref:Uncharacterized protein n=1 Tax=Trichonephila inaurata madagascariensis TaxID=2747483 RepID=A0A8X6MH28_9ARAC|nr:hypothetical protein TNIN_9851 [Trichonephila inaurata madagascariensis]